MPYAVTPDPGRRVAPRGVRTTRAAFTLRGRRVQRAVQYRARERRLARAAADAGRGAFLASLTPRRVFGPVRVFMATPTREQWRAGQSSHLGAAGRTLTYAEARRERIGGRRVLRYAAASTPRVIGTDAPRAHHYPGAPTYGPGRVAGVSGADGARYAAWRAIGTAFTPGAVALASDPATTTPRAATPTARSPRTGAPRGISGANVVRWDTAGGLPVVSSSRFYRGDAVPAPRAPLAPLPGDAVRPCAECRALALRGSGAVCAARHSHAVRHLAGPIPGDAGEHQDHGDAGTACAECGRTFATPRGAAQHARKAHA